MYSEQMMGCIPRYQGTRIQVETHVVGLPDGRTAHRDVVRHPQAVVIVPFLDDTTIVMVQQYRTAAKQTLLEVPAGCIEDGEDLLVAANRELREETGYRATHLELIAGGFPSPGFCTEFMHFFKATGLVQDPLPQDDDEWIHCVPMTIDALLTAISLRHIQDLKTMVGLLQCIRVP